MAEKMYETSFMSDGRKIKVTQERSPVRWVTMASSTGDLQEVRVDIHDELREEEYRLLNALPGPNGPVSPVVLDHETKDPSHPVLPIGTYENGNRQWESKGKPANRMVHVKPEFFALLESLRQAQLAKQTAARAAAPSNQERTDIVVAATMAAMNAMGSARQDAAPASAEKSAAKR